MDGYIVIVYHFGGLLLRNDDGVVEYINGRVDELTEVDADYVNLKDLESVFKGYGYEKCDRIMWLKPGAPDPEHGLQPLCLDSDINAMCAAALANGNRIHIYFDHYDEVKMMRSNAAEEEEDARESNDDSKEDISNDDSKEDVSEEESLVHEEGANEEEANDSFDENGYEYDSEELKTPRSSDDEEHDSETLARFNEKAEFGHVYLELGMEFVTTRSLKMLSKTIISVLGGNLYG
ncbi:hypothetical protein K1719_039779 [Acacia pycnantha]|nr:hypothetical protein K1719_039779 [Acacia pycnantha]